MKTKTISFLIAAFGLCSCADNSLPLYKDASAPVEKRVNDLLDRMTVDEMIAQTNLLPHWPSNDSSVRAATRGSVVLPTTRKVIFILKNF